MITSLDFRLLPHEQRQAFVQGWFESRRYDLYKSTTNPLSPNEESELKNLEELNKIVLSNIYSSRDVN
jgi:hypothetical protein